MQPKPFLINRLMKEAWQLFQIETKKKNIRFKYHLPLKDNESILVSDENKINQIIINLLGNAFKFTGSGSIDFGYKISGDELLFWITDTGRGIAPEHQARIFERFYQADISISRDFEGAGLGLPISKGLVELLGGKMWLKSQVDKGTSFYFTIPYHTTNRRPVHRSDDQISIRIKNEKPVILIVEDDETSFLFLEIVLRLEKLKMLHATSGPEAIEMCRNHPEIGLVLMDIKLPEMSGLEATRKIKAFRPDLPVIAQTAHAFLSDRQEALDAGCNDFITKPIPKNELVKIVAKYLG
jgi:CheY-like chemotaxis protein